jgi:hypothetical protein
MPFHRFKRRLGNILYYVLDTNPYAQNITYTIIAEDEAGNTITTEETGYQYKYHVILEFPSFLIIPRFITATLPAVIAYKKEKFYPFKKIKNGSCGRYLHMFFEIMLRGDCAQRKLLKFLFLGF